MASPALGAPALSSSAAFLSIPCRSPTSALSSLSRPFSPPSKLPSSPTPLLSLRSPPLSPLLSSKWKLLAAADGSSEPEEAPTSVPEPVEEQLAASTAVEAAKGEDVFAVVMVGSRQYIVIPGRFIYTQRLKGANVNDKIVLNKVLLVGTRTKAYIGQPVVTNAAVHAVVEEQGLDKKVIVFKYKKKKNYRRNIGHRQPRTRIRITGITGYQDFPAETMPETLPA
ncbi:50S ribosomal protein L21, chloroplastic [Canna indica]|uniref:50S ribosomal protein L21, chloroplastic n=1 Tax=Canna indica TaxID=4628 RepID=A0AAQ3JRF2_9LILI|nr:50S ribosomal protein L21, chloroplastic [Canna indica]